MKLPISIFPNVTEYTRANWTGYLKTRDITLTNHTDLGSDVTWEMFDKGTIHIHKPYSQSVNGALMEWSTKAPDNTRVVVMFTGTDHQEARWTSLAVFKGVAMTQKMNDGNCIIYISDTKGWTLTGLTFDIEAKWFTDCYISLYDADRLDACLTGNHLKSISVGDKLGLIYWDGDTTMNLKSISTVSTKANLDPAHPAPGAKVWLCYIVKGQSTTIDTEGLGLVSRDWTTIVPRKQLLSKSLMKAGTLDLTPCELTIESFQDTPGLQNHIWHVI
jgi:hypothetical protein